ncbi:hypothetical protein J6590_006568 [Homalodisca vitripennis]|nr:hypothetical protein J6590_006568 [Homalodisca vitripennis]
MKLSPPPPPPPPAPGHQEPLNYRIMPPCMPGMGGQNSSMCPCGPPQPVTSSPHPECLSMRESSPGGGGGGATCSPPPHPPLAPTPDQTQGTDLSLKRPPDLTG